MSESLHIPRYANPSPEKRLFDIGVSLRVRPIVASIISELVGSIQDTDPTINPYFTQQRVGTNGELFDMVKIRSYDPRDNETPINDTLAEARASGKDEVAQFELVERGIMSVTGFRPPSVEDHDKLMDAIGPVGRRRRERIVLPTRPGIISTHVIETHTGEEIDDYYLFVAESDEKDVMDASLQRDIQLARKARSLLLGESVAYDPQDQKAVGAIQ